jgi:solute carrier family 25 protein 16
MPSAPTNDASIAENPTQREGNADILVGKMNGVIRRATNVVTGATDGSSGPSPATEDHVAEVAEQGKNKPNKHSMDYIVRSFVAGGLAGCAVSIALNHPTGTTSRC